MNDVVTNNIRRLLNKEVAKRLLIKYFCEKGFTENFNQKVYPPAIQDLSDMIPEMASKVEIVPAAEELDPRTNYAKIRWDLFVLGNQRLFLGFTEHANLNEVARSIGQGSIISEKRTSSNEATAAKIVTFITRVLGESDQGFLRKNEEIQQTARIANTGAFFRRGTPARFEQHSR